MTARWFMLAMIVVLVGLPMSLSAQQSDSKTEEARGPGRFFRKLREDFSGKKEDEDKDKETPRTADRSAAPSREEGVFQPLFSPPAFLGGPAAKRGEQEQDGNQPPSRPPFKLSEPTLPPPVADSLPRPKGTAPQRLPAPPTAQRTPTPSRSTKTSPSSALPPSTAQRASATRSGASAQPGISDSPGSNLDRSFELPASPARKSPKPSLSQGFGFELTDRDDGLVIGSVKPDGNADQAELKKGDRITKIGGVEVEQKQQFEEIAEMLENGDQIEIVISRRGKEEEVTLQFGQAPAADEPNPSRNSREGGDSELASEQSEVALNESGEIRDFAPPSSGSSRYEPGVSELPEPVNGTSRQSANGFRAPALPSERSETTNQYPQAELIGVIRQQQETIRQLQQQVLELRMDQQRQQQLLQQTQQQTQGKTRGKR